MSASLTTPTHHTQSHSQAIHSSSLTIHTRIASRQTTVVKSGYLLKLDNNTRSGPLSQQQQQQQQQWKRMFVVLGDHLSFFDTETVYESGSVSKNVCNLDAFTVLKADPPNEVFEFILLLPKFVNSVTLRAASADELECWYKLLVTFPDCV